LPAIQVKPAVQWSSTYDTFQCSSIFVNFHEFSLLCSKITVFLMWFAPRKLNTLCETMNLVCVSMGQSTRLLVRIRVLGPRFSVLQKAFFQTLLSDYRNWKSRIPLS
jgi:hypothetical protein